MKREQTLLFMAIDGVLIPESENTLGTPDPGAIAWIATIDAAPWIEPMWLAPGWNQRAKTWNAWAKTQAWAIAYPLSPDQRQQAHHQFVQYGDDALSVAACWCSRRWRHRVVWVAPSFSAIAQAWADQDPRVQLISPADSEQPSIMVLRHRVAEVLSLESFDRSGVLAEGEVGDRVNNSLAALHPLPELPPQG